MITKKMLFSAGLILLSITNESLSMDTIKRLMGYNYVIDVTTLLGKKEFTPICPETWIYHKNLSSPEKEEARQRSLRLRNREGSVACSIGITLHGTQNPFDCDNLRRHFEKNTVDYGEIQKDFSKYVEVTPRGVEPNLGPSPFETGLNLVTPTYVTAKDRRILEQCYPLSLNTNKYGYPSKASVNLFEQLPQSTEQTEWIAWRNQYVAQRCSDFEQEYKKAAKREQADQPLAWIFWLIGDDKVYENHYNRAKTAYLKDLNKAVKINYIASHMSAVRSSDHHEKDVIIAEPNRNGTFTVETYATAQEASKKNGYLSGHQKLASHKIFPLIVSCPDENALIVNSKNNPNICREYAENKKRIDAFVAMISELNHQS